jgi:hypothetical protein
MDSRFPSCLLKIVRILFDILDKILYALKTIFIYEEYIKDITVILCVHMERNNTMGVPMIISA